MIALRQERFTEGLQIGLAEHCEEKIGRVHLFPSLLNEKGSAMPLMPVMEWLLQCS